MLEYPSFFCKLFELAKKFLLVMPNRGGNKIPASGVIPKWVKSNRHREREKKEEKNSMITVVSVHIFIVYARTKIYP